MTDEQKRIAWKSMASNYARITKYSRKELEQVIDILYEHLPITLASHALWLVTNMAGKHHFSLVEAARQLRHEVRDTNIIRIRL